jgi:hypothetical protein
MPHLARADLWSLEEYAEHRQEFRTRVLAHKKSRHLPLGENTRLYFEDALTIKYQIQEMLRIEKVFEADGINEELDAYNPLIPDGQNWKATFMIEYEDPDERAQHLAEMIGIEDKVWLQVGDGERIYAVADEDLDRSNDVKTSSVHFMRFELAPSMIAAAHKGEAISAGIDHSAYPVESHPIADTVRDSLTTDLTQTQVH